MMVEKRLLNQRLHNQRLAGKHFDTAEETVRWMGAVQGQDYYPSMWAIGFRTPGLTKKAFETAHQEMKIIRTWTMRSTLHHVAMEDAAWMVELTKERMLRRNTLYLKKAGLDDEALIKGMAVIQGALEGKRMVTRPVLRQGLEAAGIDIAGQRYYHLLLYAAQNGQIFIGPMEEKQQTIGLLAEWAPEQVPVTRDEALRKFTLRYLSSHGPATPHDFAWWGSLTMADARKGFELAGESLDTMELDGKVYWFVKPATDFEPTQPSLHLLPALDEYLIGYKDRTAALPEGRLLRIDPSKRGIFSPLLLDGKVVGSWKAQKKKESVVLGYHLLPDIQITEELLASGAQHYAHFFDLALEGIRVEQIK